MAIAMAGPIAAGSFILREHQDQADDGADHAHGRRDLGGVAPQADRRLVAGAAILQLLARPDRERLGAVGVGEAAGGAVHEIDRRLHPVGADRAFIFGEMPDAQEGAVGRFGVARRAGAEEGDAGRRSRGRHPCRSRRSR